MNPYRENAQVGEEKSLEERLLDSLEKVDPSLWAYAGNGSLTLYKDGRAVVRLNGFITVSPTLVIMDYLYPCGDCWEVTIPLTPAHTDRLAGLITRIKRGKIEHLIRQAEVKTRILAQQKSI